MKFRENGKLALNPRSIERHSCFFDCLRHTYTVDPKRGAIILESCTARVPLLAFETRTHQQRSRYDSLMEGVSSCFFDCPQDTYALDSKRDVMPPRKLHHSRFFDWLRDTYTSGNERDAAPSEQLHPLCFRGSLRHTHQTTRLMQLPLIAYSIHTHRTPSVMHFPPWNCITCAPFIAYKSDNMRGHFSGSGIGFVFLVVSHIRQRERCNSIRGIAWLAFPWLPYLRHTRSTDNQRNTLCMGSAPSISNLGRLCEHLPRAF